MSRNGVLQNGEHGEYCIMLDGKPCEKIHTDYGEVAEVARKWREARKEKGLDPDIVKIGVRIVSDWCICAETGGIGQ